jgi:hypothetical protein
LAGVPFFRDAAFFVVAFLSVVAFLVAATVDFALAGALAAGFAGALALAGAFAFAGALAFAGFAAFAVAFLVSLALFGGTVAYLPPETFRASTPGIGRNFIHSCEKSSQSKNFFLEKVLLIIEWYFAIAGG